MKARQSCSKIIMITAAIYVIVGGTDAMADTLALDCYANSTLFRRIWINTETATVIWQRATIGSPVQSAYAIIAPTAISWSAAEAPDTTDSFTIDRTTGILTVTVSGAVAGVADPQQCKRAATTSPPTKF